MADLNEDVVVSWCFKPSQPDSLNEDDIFKLIQLQNVLLFSRAFFFYSQTLTQQQMIVFIFNFFFLTWNTHAKLLCMCC